MPPEMRASEVITNFMPDFEELAPVDAKVLMQARMGTCAILPLAERSTGIQAREVHNKRYIPLETRC